MVDNNKFNYMLSAIDHFSKYAFSILIHDKQAETVLMGCHKFF